MINSSLHRPSPGPADSIDRPSQAPRCICLLLLLASTALSAADLRICPKGDGSPGCNFTGYAGLQQAIDQAQEGDRLVLAAGTYHPDAYHDLPYAELVIRGGALIEGKTLEIEGEPGAVLDGSAGPKVSALLMHNSKVSIRGLQIRDFRIDQAEDDLYEGHGLFIVNSEVTVQDTVLQRIPKMSLSIFGNSEVTLHRVRVLDGHVGIWMEGKSRLRAENALFSNNDSAAIAAYDQTYSEIRNSVIEASQDDGIYGEEQAALVLSNSILINNSPYAIRVEDEATINFDYCVFHGNEGLYFPEPGDGRLRRGGHVYLLDPQLDADYRPGQALQEIAGDPAIHNRDGSVSSLGIHGGPHAPESAFPKLH